MSRPVEREHDNARRRLDCRLRQGYLELPQGKEIRMKLTKGCLQSEQMVVLGMSFFLVDLEVLLVAFGAFWGIAPCIQGNT